MAQSTYGEAKGADNKKPVTGTPASGGTAIVSPTTGDYIGGGNIQDSATQNTTKVNPSDTTRRVGDWVNVGGNVWAVVPNSETDLKQKYQVIRGASAKRDLTLGDYIGAGLSAVGTGMGMKGMGVKLPVIGGIVMGAQFLQNVQDAEKRNIDAWLNQQVDYDYAVDFYTDENGNQMYKVNYDKMKDAGYGSGSEVKKATDTTNTDVMLNGDNNLTFNVSAAFARSDRYQTLLDTITENFPSLTEDEANEVVDKETGDTVLDKIKQAVKAEEIQYYYDARSIQELKKVAPNASAEALYDATKTQLIGSLSKETLEETNVVIYDEFNNKKEVNAKTYLDDIKKMSKKERDDYMLSIGNRIQSDNIGDDEKAVLKAQANALYSASSNDGEYHDLYQKDFFDTVADAGGIFTGVRLGNIFGISPELSTFVENDFFAPVISGGMDLARMVTMGKIMNGVERGLRSATVALGSKIGGSFGTFLQNVNKFAPQDVPNAFPGLKNGAESVGKWAGSTAIQFGYMAAADLAYEGIRAATYGLNKEDFNFLGELGSDMALDMLMTYGPRNYVDAMNMPKYEYRRFEVKKDPNTGEQYLVSKKYAADEKTKTAGAEEDAKKASAADDIEDEFYTTDVEELNRSIGHRNEAGLVEVTAEELSQRRAKTIDKITDSKVGMKVQELFFDKNAAMAKLAVQVRAAGGGKGLYKKILRFANDIRQITKDTMNEYRQFGSVSKHIDAMAAKLREVAPKAKDFTKEDAAYINAMANHHRFTAEHKGDKKAIGMIDEFYKKAMNGVSDERKVELDELMTLMRAVAGDVLDYYQAKGLLTADQVKQLRKSPAYKGGMFLPVWAKDGVKNAGEISQSRAKLKKVFDKSQLIAVEDLEDPLVTLGSYINNAMRNVAINDRAMAIREGAELAGVGIHLYSDTGGGLEEVKNLKELNEDFGKRYEKIVKDVKGKIPSHQQWQKINDNLVLESKALKNAEGLQKIRTETAKLEREYAKLKRAQEKRGTQVDTSGVKLIDQPKDMSEMLKLKQRTPKVKEIKTLEDVLKADKVVGRAARTMNLDEIGSSLRALLTESFKNGSRPGAEGLGEDAIRDLAEEVYQGMRKQMIDSFMGKRSVDQATKAVADVLRANLSENEIAKLVEDADKFYRADVNAAIEIRNRYIQWWNETEELRRNLGIESYTYGYEDTKQVPGAFGNYGNNGTNPYRPSKERSLTPEVNTGRRFTNHEQEIRIAISTFNSLEDMKSTIVHEAAHAAFARAANRVPLLTDALRTLGIDAKVSEDIANSSDATELIAYMTQKKFLADMDQFDSSHFKNNATVQKHLNNIMKRLGDKTPVNFKERFIDQIKNIITFVKGKLVGTLADVKTLDDFYNGLIGGQFANGMRVSTIGAEVKRSPYKGLGLMFDWSKVDAEGAKMAQDLIDIRTKIDANKQEELRLMDEIKEDVRTLMNDAQKASKGSPVKIDIDMYVDVQVTNSLKKAFQSDNPTGQIQAILNDAVETANPYVSRKDVIDKLASKEAEKFRKGVNRKMVIDRRSGGKMSADHLNALADKVADVVTQRVTGKKPRVSAIDDDQLTRFLSEGGGGHTIRYMQDGKEQRMVLSGKGSEALVQEFYDPEFNIKSPWAQIPLKAAKNLGQLKRILTTSMDPTRVLPNLARDWTRGIVSTGGDILLSPDMLRTEVIDSGRYSEAEIQKINNGFELAKAGIEGSTFTESMQTPKKNRKKSMIRAMNEPVDGNSFQKFIYDRTESAGKFFSTLQDAGETFTRKRAMEIAYYKELAAASARGMKIDDAVKLAVDAAYFAGREATTNFFRRGKLISQVAQFVPYLSQKFATLESFKYSYIDDPITVVRSLKSTVSTYAALIAIALSNDESRKRYYLLTEYERANNIIIPLTNDMIVKVPLDDTVSAFLTPYRRMIETLNGVDPEAFYLWGAEFLEALSPLDLTGFSEGDKFNVVRGFQKLGAELVPTWALPILESMTGTDWYYGSDISIDEEYVGARTGNYSPTPGELTTKSANSQVLAGVSNATGIPQWVLQRFYSEYGGNIGQYVLNVLDKLGGATEEAQGGTDFFKSVFKPFTGGNSDDVTSAFWDGTNVLEEKKKSLQNEIRTINTKIKAATGEAKAELINQRQEKIKAYGLEVSDFLNQYLSAYEITGGLTKQQANRVYRLYDLYSEDDNQSLYLEDSVEDYYADKARKQVNKNATNLAARSGMDKYYDMTENDYDSSYAMEALKNSVYGVPLKQMVEIANILEDTSDYDNSFTKLRQDAFDARSKAYDAKNYDLADKIAYQYDYQILSALYPYLVKNGIAETLNRSKVMDYIADWIMVPSSEMKTSKGRYVPNLGTDAQKEKAFKKQFVKKMYGVLGE